MKRILIPILGILAAGCVTNNTPSTGEQAKDYLEVWMAKWNKDNSKDIQPDALGMYILEDVPGAASEPLWSASSPYTVAEITIRSLSGTIATTDNEDLAKQLGTYSPLTYYGPKVFMTGEGVSYAGVDAAMEGMRMGGRRTVVVPAWLTTTSRHGSLQKYLDACTSSTHLIYTIDLREQFDDVTAWEKAQVEAYVNANFPGATATVMPGSEEGSEADGTFWFISDVSGFKEEDKRQESENELTLNYTGNRLDGKIFDTTIMKTAVDNDVYNASSSYKPLSVSFNSDWSETSINGSTSYVDGFKAGVSLMWWPGQKATVIFTSGHGYGTSSKGLIPAYCPLVFQLELIDKQE